MISVTTSGITMLNVWYFIPQFGFKYSFYMYIYKSLIVDQRQKYKVSFVLVFIIIDHLFT